MVRRASGRPSRKDKIENQNHGSAAGKKVSNKILTKNPVTKPGDNPVTKPGDNPVTKPGDNPVTKPGDNPVTKPGDNPVIKPGDNPVTKPGDNPVMKQKHIINIIGNDQKIARFLFHSSLSNGNEYESKPFTKRELSQDLDVKYETLRSSLKRLKKWGFIDEIFSTKGGPGSVSWVRFNPSRYEEMRREYKQVRATRKTR